MIIDVKNTDIQYLVDWVLKNLCTPLHSIPMTVQNPFGVEDMDSKSLSTLVPETSTVTTKRGKKKKKNENEEIQITLK